MRSVSFAGFGGAGRRLVRSAPCMDFMGLRRPPPWPPPLPPLPPRPRRRRLRLLPPRLLPPFPPLPLLPPSRPPRLLPPLRPPLSSRLSLPLLPLLPPSRSACASLPPPFAGVSLGAWKTGCCSVASGGPALRVTLRARLRGSFIFIGLQPVSFLRGAARPARPSPQRPAGAGLLLRCPAVAELPLQMSRRPARPVGARAR